MSVRMLMLIVVATACAGGCGDSSPSQPNAAASAIFAPARSHDAIRNAGPDGLVIVDFTATWCGPCKQMERTVWSDARITDWLRDHRIVLVHSDADANTDERDAYGVSAWPTVLVLKNGQTADRRLGYQGVEQLLGMLNRASGVPDPSVTELQVLPPEHGRP